MWTSDCQYVLRLSDLFFLAIQRNKRKDNEIKLPVKVPLFYALQHVTNEKLRFVFQMKCINYLVSTHGNDRPYEYLLGRHFTRIFAVIIFAGIKDCKNWKKKP